MDKVYEVFTWGGNRITAEWSRLNIKARKAFSFERWGSITEVWELDFEGYTLLLSDPELDSEWRKRGVGWQYSLGSNLGPVNKRFTINGHYLKAWAGDRGFTMNRFKNLSQYLEYVVGATTERNVHACYACLAKQNGLKLSELLRKYRP